MQSATTTEMFHPGAASRVAADYAARLCEIDHQIARTLQTLDRYALLLDELVEQLPDLSRALLESDGAHLEERLHALANERERLAEECAAELARASCPRMILAEPVLERVDIGLSKIAGAQRAAQVL